MERLHGYLDDQVAAHPDKASFSDTTRGGLELSNLRRRGRRAGGVLCGAWSSSRRPRYDLGRELLCRSGRNLCLFKGLGLRCADQPAPDRCRDCQINRACRIRLWFLPPPKCHPIPKRKPKAWTQVLSRVDLDSLMPSGAPVRRIRIGMWPCSFIRRAPRGCLRA